MSSPYTPVNVWHAGAVTVPSDGDPRAAASVSSPLEFLADNVTYLYNRINGAYRMVGPPVFSVTNSAALSWTSTTFTDVVSPMLSAGIAPLVNDIIIVDLWSTLQISNAGGGVNFSASIRLQDSQNGGGYTDIPGAGTGGGGGGIGALLAASAGVANTVAVPIRVAGVRTITSAGPYQIKLQGIVLTGNTGTLGGPFGAVMTMWRAN